MRPCFYGSWRVASTPPLPQALAEDDGVVPIDHHRVVGTSVDGRRLAVVLAGDDHVELLVLEAGVGGPVFRDVGEHEQEVLRRNLGRLSRLGVKQEALDIAAGQWPDNPASDGIIQGFVEPPERSPISEAVAFTISPQPSERCEGMEWSVSALHRHVPAAELGPHCVHDVSLRQVYETGGALWFVTEESTADGPAVGFAGLGF